jgi:glycogen synthase
MRVAMVTYSSVRWDSRIRRIVGSLASAGHEVTLLSPDIEPHVEGMSRHVPVPAILSTRTDALRSALLMAPSSILPQSSLSLHRLQPAFRATREALIALSPDVVHANDWVTLPAAIAAKTATGCRVVYDSHEMATEEHAHRPLWRLIGQKHVRTIERLLIPNADSVMTVGEGLSKALLHLYPHLERAPVIVRNIPALSTPIFRPVGERRIITYVGLIRPERHLDVAIEALAGLDARYALRITGFGPESHFAELRKLAGKIGASDRIEWREAVPPEAIVKAIEGADIGLFLAKATTGQQLNALPNKIFEYIAGGTAVVASGSSDVAKLLTLYGNGCTLEQTTPEALAALLISLSDDDINRMKQASIEAHTDLSWASEEKPLLGVYQNMNPRNNNG